MNNVMAVIKGLECCIGNYPGDKVCICCKYQPYRAGYCRNLAIKDAIKILRAQEPIEPKIIEFVDKGMTWEKYEVSTCGACGALLGGALFCPQCGRPVKYK